ncbi:disulfide bond formation protein B [Patescibacteria group bacterium]|nr:MAG: disulfide bond formation protein B [Patescibacteria group bacterium]
MKTLSEQFKKYSLHLAFVQSVVATFGSLFFSEVMHLTPCTLCWYQRILMYPLIWITAVGIMKKDKNSPLYILPLAIFGWLIALYHNLLYYKLIPDTLSPCSLGVSCTTKYFAWFGFVTIPLLSFVAFSIIIACVLAYKKSLANNK